MFINLLHIVQVKSIRNCYCFQSVCGCITLQIQTLSQKVHIQNFKHRITFFPSPSKSDILRKSPRARLPSSGVSFEDETPACGT